MAGGSLWATDLLLMTLAICEHFWELLGEGDERQDGSLVVMRMESATPLCWNIPCEILKYPLLFITPIVCERQKELLMARIPVKGMCRACRLPWERETSVPGRLQHHVLSQSQDDCTLLLLTSFSSFHGFMKRTMPALTTAIPLWP